MVKRYDTNQFSTFSGMVESQDGDCVKHEDYAAIKAELDKWKSAHASVVKDARELSIKLVDALDELDALREQLKKKAKIDGVNDFTNEVCGDCATSFQVQLSQEALKYAQALESAYNIAKQ